MHGRGDMNRSAIGRCDSDRMVELANCMEVCQTSIVPSQDVQDVQLARLPPIDKVDIAEVCIKPTSRAPIAEVQGQVKRMLEKRNLSYANGPLSIAQDGEPFLFEHVQSICICDADEQGSNGVLLFWQVNLKIYLYQLNDEGPGEETEETEGISSFQEWVLPAREFFGLWESLIYDTGLKKRLLQYSETALLFADKGVDSHLVSWNRVILLHGPPGTGKTSLCKALAQKLSIRFNGRYNQSQLIEVNAHSLFSKWFSESGKLVTKLFYKIQELIEEEDILVFVLIDEVESLAAARQTALAGSEPSDSIRVVNALLTQLDKLKSWKNVVVLTTSNITAAVDIAFVDRADIKAYIGLPNLQACYEILRSCLKELLRTGIISLPMHAGTKEVDFLSFKTLIHWSTDSEQPCAEEESEASFHLSRSLLATAQACQGLSGRTLRKLPFLAHASLANKLICDCSKFLLILADTAQRELSERSCT